MTCRVEEDMDTSNEEENYTMAIAKDMAKALVQIARGIESKYLQPPLGMFDLVNYFVKQY